MRGSFDMNTPEPMAGRAAVLFGTSSAQYHLSYRLCTRERPAVYAKKVEYNQ
jgi:hypothetical protein